MEGFLENRHDGDGGGQRQTSPLTDKSPSSLDEFYEDVLTQEDDVKLQETPIVYTTKLDDMDIFNLSDNCDLNDLTNCILRASKPRIENKCLPSSGTDKTSYDILVNKLNELNEKIRCNKRNVSYAQETQYGNETNNLLEKLHKIKSEPMKSNIYTNSFDELANECPKIDRNKSTETNTLFIKTETDEDCDVQLLNYNAIPTATSSINNDQNRKSVEKNNKRKSDKHSKTYYENAQCNTTITTDTDSDEDVSLAIIKYKKKKLDIPVPCKQLRIFVEDISIGRRKLREKPFTGPGILYGGKWFRIKELSTLNRKIKNVYLFFHDKCTQIIDIYIIENRRMIEHKKVNFNTSSVILKNRFNLKETIEIECYCWYEKMEVLESGIFLASDMTFMKKRHNCEQSKCVCCCLPRNNKETESTAVGNYKLSQENLEIKQMEEEISQKIGTIESKDICYSVLKHNDWNDTLDMEKSAPSFINECLRYNRGMEDNPIFLNTNNVNDHNQSIKLLNSKSLDKGSNTQPHLLTPRACEEKEKKRLSMKIRPLLTPDRPIQRVAKFKIKPLRQESFPEESTSINCLDTVLVKPDRLSQKKPSAKFARLANNKRRKVNNDGICRSQFNLEGLEKTLINTQNTEHSKSQMVKNIAKSTDSLELDQFLGQYLEKKHSSLAKTSTHDQSAGAPSALQRNKTTLSSESNVNPAVSNLEADKLGEDSSITVTALYEKFDIQLIIDKNRKVSAALNVPLTTLSPTELKVLATIIFQAQHQLDALAILPGSYLPNTNLKEITSSETTKVQPSNSHQTTIIQDAKAQQQKSYEKDLLPETNTVEAIPINHAYNIITEADSLSVSDINKIETDSNFFYKMFSGIVKKKKDSYKKSFMAVNSNPIPEDPSPPPPPPIKISKVYSLAADAAAESLTNKTKGSKCKGNKKSNSLPLKNRKTQSGLATVQVTSDPISAQCITEPKIKIEDQSADFIPTESSNKNLIVLPNMRVNNYEIIFFNDDEQLK